MIWNRFKNRFRSRVLFRCGVFVALCLLNFIVQVVQAQTSITVNVNPGETVLTSDHDNGRLIQILEFKECESFILVPAENVWGRPMRGFLYLMGLFYFFLGIAIVADLFMAAIEVITSKTRTVTEINPVTGQEETIELQVWNATVANLTLMALGSSAPEILLAVIETVMNLGKEPGELGPSTIVGSAAFNLLVISAVCVVSVPDGEIRRIEELGVFIITAVASIFAYVWLLVVLVWNGKGEISMAEAWITLAFFPVLVFLSYGQDIGWKFGKSKVAPTHGHEKLVGARRSQESEEEIAERVKAVAAINQARAAAQKGPHDEHLTNQQAAKDVARALIAERRHQQRVTRAQYRINAVRGFAGQRRVIPVDHAAGKKHDGGAAQLLVPSGNVRGGSGAWDQHARCKFQFSSPAYSVNEDEGAVQVEVTCHWDTSDATTQDPNPVTVKYATRDGTAIAPDDYQHTEGVLEFQPGQTTKTIMIPVVDDNEFEDDEVFYVQLSSPSDGTALDRLSVAVVTIIDNDNPGTFNFSNKRYATREEGGKIRLTVTRSDGASGTATVDYETKDGSALAEKDYKPAKGTLTFLNGETSKSIDIDIINMPENDADETFTVTLSNPSAGAYVGSIPSATVIITEDEDFLRLVGEASKFVEEQMKNFDIGTSSWGQQFKDAMVVAGEIDEDGSELPPQTIDYIMHFLTFMWKILFATVPPTEWGGGWAAFFVSLAWVGVLTTIVAELASLFGCVVGLLDSVTAITFVALGTSLPDTFASKQATVQEETADTAIGNVTGSNAVNVFLGLGLPWVIATIYHAANDSVPDNYPVPEGDLSFSVLVFVICGTVCLVTLSVRRMKFCGGELGGPKALKWVTAVCFCTMWLLYVILSSLKAYKHID
eukprot:TRINITY_DN2512_c0_g4_i2.p1 TRINITY_DN2512_c0_g4~~TRINITY_DN2512_c0_g4_i2.p1  ORF type:complete len:886 (-),score=274.86 TRINITY_DN2512_c0_g4_i2:228-2885(-)